MTKKELEIEFIRFKKEIRQNKELTTEALANQLALANAEIRRLKKQNEILTKKLKQKRSTPKHIRSTKEYKIFREKILQRNHNKCTKCGSNENLQVHHIKSINKYPELALDENNVITLCVKCHSETDNYLKK